MRGINSYFKVGINPDIIIFESEISDVATKSKKIWTQQATIKVKLTTYMHGQLKETETRLIPWTYSVEVLKHFLN